mgnify:CR=1 FL=1
MTIGPEFVDTLIELLDEAYHYGGRISDLYDAYLANPKKALLTVLVPTNEHPLIRAEKCGRILEAAIGNLRQPDAEALRILLALNPGRRKDGTDGLTLTERRKMAASRYGISADGFRRKGGHEDRITRALAIELWIRIRERHESIETRGPCSSRKKDVLVGGKKENKSEFLEPEAEKTVPQKSVPRKPPPPPDKFRPRG